MSNVYNDIRTAFGIKLKQIADLKAVEIAWENSRFAPDGRSYYSQYLLNVNTTTASLGGAGLDYNVGIYQVNVNCPSGDGSGRINELADAIADGFKIRTPLSQGEVGIRVLSVNRSPASADGKYRTIAVDIEFETYTNQRA